MDKWFNLIYWLIFFLLHLNTYTRSCNNVLRSFFFPASNHLLQKKSWNIFTCCNVNNIFINICFVISNGTHGFLTHFKFTVNKYKHMFWFMLKMWSEHLIFFKVHSNERYVEFPVAQLQCVLSKNHRKIYE